MTPDELREWRKRLGLTRAQAACALGLSASWIESAETGRRPIKRPIQLACERIEDTRRRKCGK